jgi:hypothetical protein
VSSRAVFMFVNDSEGPNLLVVTILAVIIFFAFLAVYLILKRFGIISK